VPLSAILQEKQDDSAVVFVYHGAGGVVHRRGVRLGAIQGERVEVRSGVQPGEQIAAMGAAFLSDGQKVVPLQVTSHLADGGAP